MTMQTRLLINGEFQAGQGDIEDVLNPATGDVVVKVAEASLDQVQAAVAAAQKAFAGWARTTPKDRATLLLKLADGIESRATEFARLESLNCGKPYQAVLNDEIPAVADVFRFFCRRVSHATWPVGWGISARVYQHGATRSAGRGGLDCAVELPADDGGVETRPGHRRG